MMDTGTATLGLAASITDRAHDLIQEGWIKGAFYGGEGRVETFCILGALDLALDELLGNDAGLVLARQDVRDIATKFILDEALDQYKYTSCSIPGFNDASERTHEQVLSVLSKAASRLWDLSVVNEDVGANWAPSRWAEVDPVIADAAKYEYMNAVLA